MLNADPAVSHVLIEKGMHGAVCSFGLLHREGIGTTSTK